MTTDKDLPALPRGYSFYQAADVAYTNTVFTTDQMHAYARQAVAEALAGKEAANKKQAAGIELFKRSVTENAIPRANAELRERAERAEADAAGLRQANALLTAEVEALVGREGAVPVGLDLKSIASMLQGYASCIKLHGDFELWHYIPEIDAMVDALAHPAAQPAPAEAWPKLEAPAKVGGGTFGIGVSARLVVEAAQRQFDIERVRHAMTTEELQEQERTRREVWDLINGSPAAPSAPAPAQGEREAAWLKLRGTLTPTRWTTSEAATYRGFFNHGWQARAALAAKPAPARAPGINAGHGHVWARPDGVKARCGGPGVCKQCSRDRGALAAQPSAAPEPVAALVNLIAAVDAEMHPDWECNSYHPSLSPALEAARIAAAPSTKEGDHV